MKALAGSRADRQRGWGGAPRNAGVIRLQAKACLEAERATLQAGGQGRVCPSSHKGTCQQPPPPLGQCLPQHHKCLPPGVHFAAPQVPSARSLAAPAPSGCPGPRARSATTALSSQAGCCSSHHGPQQDRVHSSGCTQSRPSKEHQAPPWG